MKPAVFLALFVVCAFAFSIEEEFSQFVAKYERNYDSHDEFLHRQSVFAENLKWAAAHQAMNPLAQFGVTQFSDLSPEEFRRMYLTADASLANLTATPELKTNFDGEKWEVLGNLEVDPTNWDWSSAGVVTGVYDQGQCGSCWAFSATETIESYWALTGHGLPNLSMEQIVDCDSTCYGCNGGWPYMAYQYVNQAGGIDSYDSYPYTAGNGQAGSCQADASSFAATVSSYNSLSGESGIYAQMSSQSGGPVSICVDASSWQYYQGGVLTTCGNNIDHCVQATGYANWGSSSAYWNVRNSWGTSWGQSGYIFLAAGYNMCGIGSSPTIALI